MGNDKESVQWSMAKRPTCMPDSWPSSARLRLGQFLSTDSEAARARTALLTDASRERLAEPCLRGNTSREAVRLGSLCMPMDWWSGIRWASELARASEPARTSCDVRSPAQPGSLGMNQLSGFVSHVRADSIVVEHLCSPAISTATVRDIYTWAL